MLAESRSFGVGNGAVSTDFSLRARLATCWVKHSPLPSQVVSQSCQSLTRHLDSTMTSGESIKPTALARQPDPTLPSHAPGHSSMMQATN